MYKKSKNNNQGYPVREFHILGFPDNIYVLIKEEFRKRLFKQIYSKFRNKTKTAKKLDISLRTLLNYERGFSIKNKIKYRQLIPVKFLKKIVDSGEQNSLEKNISAISVRCGLKVYDPKLPIKESAELYRVIAHMLGDGSASKGKTPYYANTCKKLREQFIKDLLIFGGVNTYERKPNTTPIIFFPKVITDILIHTFNIKFTYPDRIPKELFKTKKRCKKVFLQALYDDEGTISSNLSICMNSENLLEQIKRLLKYFDISTGQISKTKYKTKKGKRYRVSFNISKKSYNAFQKEINFSHPDKIENLELAIQTKNRVQRTRNPFLVGEEILKDLEYGPLSTIKLANKLSFTINGILPHLNRLYKQKDIVKKGYKNKVFWDLN